MDGTPGKGAVINDFTPASVQVFGIHFICAEISRHLSRRSIRRCTRVSRAFHAAFQPYLWRNIFIVRPSTLEKFQTIEHQAALRQHAHHVETITTIFTSAWPLICTALGIQQADSNTTLNGAGPGTSRSNREDNEQPTEPVMRVLPNLQFLHFSVLRDRLSNVSPKFKGLPLIFPLLNPFVVPRLRRLWIENFDYDQWEASVVCMARIRRLETLRELKIGFKRWTVRCEMFRKILESIPQVETLIMNVSLYHISTDTPNEEAATWETGPPESALSPIPRFIGPFKLPERFAMKKLDLQTWRYPKDLDSIVVFLKRCPNMENITIPLSHPAYSQFVELLKGWVYLRKLTLVESVLSDDMLAEVIRSAHHGDPSLQQSSPTSSSKRNINASYKAQGLESLCILDGKDSYPETSQAIISSHGQTLVSIVLTRSKVVNRADLQRLLCSCPNLETLDAMSFFALDKWRDPILYTADILAVSGSAAANESVAWGWVCTRLRVLKLRYLPRETETGWDTGIPYELAVQLSRMRCLEDLRLGRMAGDMHDRPAEIIASSLALTSMSGSVSADIPLTDLNSVMRDGDENPEVNGKDSTLFTVGTTDQQTRSNECHLEEETRRRTESVTMALRIFARELSRLKTLELRGLKTFVVHDEISRAKTRWNLTVS